MRHQKALLKLNRTSAHRRALLRNMATSLVLHGQIETTLPKAKALKPFAEKLITLGKKNTLHARRKAMSILFAVNREEAGNSKKWTAVHRLFEELAPRYENRNGGYTRVIRTRKRDGDKAQLAVIQFVEATPQGTKSEKRRRRKVVTDAPTPAAAEATAAE